MDATPLLAFNQVRTKVMPPPQWYATPPMEIATPPWKVPPPPMWCMAMVAAKYIGLWGQISSFGLLPLAGVLHVDMFLQLAALQVMEGWYDNFVNADTLSIHEMIKDEAPEGNKVVHMWFLSSHKAEPKKKVPEKLATCVGEELSLSCFHSRLISWWSFVNFADSRRIHCCWSTYPGDSCDRRHQQRRETGRNGHSCQLLFWRGRVQVQEMTTCAHKFCSQGCRDFVTFGSIFLCNFLLSSAKQSPALSLQRWRPFASVYPWDVQLPCQRYCHSQSESTPSGNRLPFGTYEGTICTYLLYFRRENCWSSGRFTLWTKMQQSIVFFAGKIWISWVRVEFSHLDEPGWRWRSAADHCRHLGRARSRSQHRRLISQWVPHHHWLYSRPGADNFYWR